MFSFDNMSNRNRFGYFFFFEILIFSCISEKITYINVEHPHVAYYDKNFFAFVNLTTTRYGRANPVYYVGFHFENVVAFDNNILVDFYFYELLTNQYKRSFVEFHYTWCSLVEKDMFFGAAMRQGKLLQPCPHPSSDYHLYNMTIHPSFIPRGFPFTRGRIQCNVTQAKTKLRIADGHIDMRISQIEKKKGRF